MSINIAPKFSFELFGSELRSMEGTGLASIFAKKSQHGKRHNPAEPESRNSSVVKMVLDMLSAMLGLVTFVLIIGVAWNDVMPSKIDDHAAEARDLGQDMSKTQPLSSGTFILAEQTSASDCTEPFPTYVEPPLETLYEFDQEFRRCDTQNTWILRKTFKDAVTAVTRLVDRGCQLLELPD